MTLALTKVYQVRSRTEEAFGSVTSSWSFVICCLLRTNSYKYGERLEYLLLFLVKRLVEYFGIS